MDSATNAPIDLLRAINHANKILDWYDNLSHEEIPPEWMWPFDTEIGDWFDEVRQARKDKYSGGSADTEGDEMTSNEYERAYDG